MKADAVCDARGRHVALAPPPRRIVALVPSVTRCLFDLGVGDRVVGRTEYCTEPPGMVDALPTVGGPKTVDVARLVALRPDLVLADAEENQRDQVAALEAQGLRVYVALPRNLPLVAAFLRDLGTLVARPAAGRWADELPTPNAPTPHPTVRVACLVWKDPYMAAAPDTLPHALLTAAGGHNTVVQHDGRRYPEITVAELARGRPRVLLLPDDPYPFSAADAAQLESAVPGATALRIPGHWVSWYGSRMVDALHDLTARLDPYRRAADSRAHTR